MSFHNIVRYLVDKNNIPTMVWHALRYCISDAQPLVDGVVVRFVYKAKLVMATPLASLLD